MPSLAAACHGLQQAGSGAQGPWGTGAGRQAHWPGSLIPPPASLLDACLPGISSQGPLLAIRAQQRHPPLYLVKIEG